MRLGSFSLLTFDGEETAPGSTEKATDSGMMRVQGDVLRRSCVLYRMELLLAASLS